MRSLIKGGCDAFQLRHLLLMSFTLPRYAFSPVSLARASTCSSATSSSGWTSSTEWGPGALTGKALLAVGERALRAVENLIPHTKLRAYQLRFPHNDEDSVRGLSMDEMYNDILEMSRYDRNLTTIGCAAMLIRLVRQDLYSDSMRFRARKLLLIQVGRRQTARLITALLKWPEEEILLFMVSVFDEMSMFWCASTLLRESLPMYTHSSHLSRLGSCHNGSRTELLFPSMAVTATSPRKPATNTTLRCLCLHL